MKCLDNNKTIEYYDDNAEKYFSSTVDADMSECCERFLKYLTPGGLIADIGAGSGRDIKYFLNRGFRVEGIDASKEMCKLASEYTGINVECQTIQEWNPSHGYDGIWANASLLHIEINEIQKFICKLPLFLNDGGITFISLKSGIDTGCDSDGRFFINIKEPDIQHIIEKSTELSLLDIWNTEDKLSRKDFFWINIILRKNV